MTQPGFALHHTDSEVAPEHRQPVHLEPDAAGIHVSIVLLNIQHLFAVDFPAVEALVASWLLDPTVKDQPARRRSETRRGGFRSLCICCTVMEPTGGAGVGLMSRPVTGVYCRKTYLEI